MDSQSVIKSYPKSNFIASKVFEGVEHFVVFDERPSQFAVEMKSESGIVLFILPAYFNADVLNMSLFSLIIADIVLSGKIVLGEKSKILTLGLFFKNFLTQRFLKLPLGKRKLITSLKSASTYFSSLPRQLTTSDTKDLKNLIFDLYFPCKSDFLAFNKTLFAKYSLPTPIHFLLDDNDVDDPSILTLCESIQSENRFLDTIDTLLYYVELQNDYDDILISLLEHCKSELSELVEKSALFFWLEESSQRMKLKVTPPKSEYRNTLRLLRLIDVFLKRNFQKGIMKFTSNQLYEEQELYLLRSNFNRDYESKLFDFLSSIIFQNRTSWNPTIRIDCFLRLAISILKTLDETLVKEFTQFLFFNWFNIKEQFNSSRTFIDFERVAKFQNRQLEYWIETIQYNAMAEEVLGGGPIIECCRDLVSKTILINERNTYKLRVVQTDWLIFQQNCSSESNMLFSNLLAFFEKVTQNMGFENDDKIKAAYGLKFFFAES